MSPVRRRRGPSWRLAALVTFAVVAWAALVLGGEASVHPRRHQHHRRSQDQEPPVQNQVDVGEANKSPDSAPPRSFYQQHRASGGVFLTSNCTVVLAQIGSTPVMHCEVDDIGEGTVSWIRRKDYHLLTVGLATYSSDERFYCAHVHTAQDWALHVRYAQAQDGGLYECQVSTHPPTSLFVELKLVEAQAEILGSPDKFVKSGSSLRLTCVLRRSTEPPVYVFWYRDERMINYDEERGVRVRHARYSSELLVAEAQRSDTGNYTCVPSNARPASINVHILNGEEPAAMQHGSKGAASSPRMTSPGWRAVVVALCAAWLAR